MLMAVVKVNKKKYLHGFWWVTFISQWFQWFEKLHRFIVGLQQIARDTKVVIYKVVQWMERKDKTAHRHTQTHNERQWQGWKKEEKEKLLPQ